MKQDYTHIAFLIDRSGSMSLIREDMEGGIATFMDEQKNKPGTCTITAAHFDNEFELLFTRKPIADVETIKIVPRGWTALIDSMARLINEVGADLNSLSEDEKPERVLFITITDGEENSSHETTNEKLKELIKEQEDKYNWNFTYIGANQDAFSNAQKFGGKFTNSMNYSATTNGVNKMFSKLSDATTRYRSASVQTLSADSFQYTAEEQKDLE